MAIYHLSMKAVSRSAGRSATAAIAYRSGTEITDERTGQVHDYTRKTGVEFTQLILPECLASRERAEFWNSVELHHKRGDALVAREFVVALPSELSAAERERLATDFGREVANHYKVAADVCIHAPGKEGDQRNHHAHILLSACSVSPDGLGKKVAELDPIHCKRHQLVNPADQWRGRWADLTNARLRDNGVDAHVDHRSLEDQGVDRVPTVHLGPSVTAMARRGVDTRVKAMLDAQVRAAREMADKIRATIQQIADLALDLAAAKKEYIGQVMRQGTAQFRAKFAAYTAQKQAQDRAELARQEMRRQERLRIEQARQKALQTDRGGGPRLGGLAPKKKERDFGPSL